MKKISSIEEYNSEYKRSVEQPEEFWAEVAENFSWKKKMGFGSKMGFQ
jgi:acetyl-CoA synthetase